MGDECIADPSTTARWTQARASHKIIPQWSLRQCCLGTVKDSLLTWSRDRNKRIVNPDRADENPFLEYPIHLRQDLLDSLLRLKPNGRELLKAAELLLSSGIEHFDLSCLDDCKFTDVSGIIKTLIRNGYNLRELSIAGQWMYWPGSSDLIRTLLKSVPNLKSLKLQHTTKELKELEMIASHCPLLQKLEVMHPSTDEADIISFVESVTANPACHALQEHLREFLLPSSVNGSSMLSLLHVFPRLEHVSCTFLEQLLEEGERQVDHEMWQERMSRLYAVHITHPTSFDTIEKLVSWYPRLQEVSLEVQEDMELEPLSLLTELKVLELRNSPTLPASYTDEVIPLIKTCGSKLDCLSIERFDVVDLARTANLCPNLKEFSAQWFTILGTTTSRPCKQPFRCLQHLRLRPRVNRRIQVDACDLLLTWSRGLKHLELYCCYSLTDIVVSRLIQVNPLSRLETLILRHGHGLSAAGIRLITTNAHKLRNWDIGDVVPYVQ